VKRLLGLAVLALTITVHAEPPHKLRVVTSFLPLYCFTVNVAADLASVENLLVPGVTPHDFQFSVSDLRRIKDADLILLNGLGLENWKSRLLRSSSAKAIVEVADGLDAQYIRRDGAVNPHVWLDPSLAIHCVSNIVTALSQSDPSHAPDYAANGMRYIARLQQLDRELADGLRPFTGAPVIGYHDAFPYFARRYGLRVVGVVELIPEVGPSPKHLAALHQIVRRENVKLFLTDAEAPSRLTDVVRKDFALSEVRLDTLETGPLTPTAYEDAMRNNLHLLQERLR
jgi:ABC-type Zn uptake system ZnuABC Zn-binding protein ZnuA